METRILKGFKEHFNAPHPFVDAKVSAIIGDYQFDILRFDDWCIKEHGYDMEEHGSLADFVTMKWGAEATAFLESLLKSKL